METSVKEGVKEIRMTIEEFETILRKAKLITSQEGLCFTYGAFFEPGELIIRVVK